MRTLKKLWLSSFIFLASCQLVVPNVKDCSVAGKLAAGMNCAETQTGKTFSMDLNQTIEFLEPDEKSNRSGAICMSSEDYNRIQTVLEQACRQLGTKCTNEIQSALRKNQ